MPTIPKLLLIAAVTVSRAVFGAEPGAKVLIVSSQGVEAYDLTSKALANQLREAGLKVNCIEIAPDGNEVLIASAMLGGPYKTIVAVGPEARWSVAKVGARVPVVSTMMFLADLEQEGSGGRNAPGLQVGAVYLDADPADIATALRKALPDLRRAGILLDKTQDKSAMQAAFEKAKFTMVAAQPGSPAEVASAFLSLKGKVDFVLCLPSARLYTAKSMEELLRASNSRNLPVIGFSEVFLKAGASGAVFASYGSIANQTAEMVKRVAAGAKSVEDETPKGLEVRMSAKAAKSLGLAANFE